MLGPEASLVESGRPLHAPRRPKTKHRTLDVSRRIDRTRVDISSSPLFYILILILTPFEEGTEHIAKEQANIIAGKDIRILRVS